MTTLDQHTTPREIATGVLWTWILAALVLTAALTVVAGAFILKATAVQVVLGLLLVATIVFFWHQHKHRGEIEMDPRVRHARERRGF